MLPSPPTPLGRGRRGAGCREGSSAPLSASRPQSNATPTTGSPLRGVSKRAQQGQSAGCSGQDLFTSNHESMQLRGDGKGDTSPAGQAAPWGLAPRVGSLGRECLTLACGDPTYPLPASRREDTQGGPGAAGVPVQCVWAWAGPRHCRMQGVCPREGQGLRGMEPRRTATATGQRVRVGGCTGQPVNYLQGLKGKEVGTKPRQAGHGPEQALSGVTGAA